MQEQQALVRMWSLLPESEVSLDPRQDPALTAIRNNRHEVWVAFGELCSAQDRYGDWIDEYGITPFRSGSLQAAEHIEIGLREDPRASYDLGAFRRSMDGESDDQ